jgi:hypothetical protein
MKKKYTLIKYLIFFILIIPLQGFCQVMDTPVDINNTGNLRFIENKSQWEKNILFKADISNGAVFLENNCFTFVFKDMEAISKLMEFKTKPSDQRPVLTPADFNIKCHAYKVCFMNAKEDAIITANQSDKGYFNYYPGNDPAHWASNVKSFRAVTYKNLYEKTDMTIYENDSRLKYDFVLHPGADISNIQIKIEGAEKVFIRDGNLIIKTSVNEVTELSPVSFQGSASDKKNIACKFILNDNVITFNFPDGYDETLDLTIDPTLIFSTYSGSTIDNWGFTATFDSQGNVYSGGIAFGTGYPTSVGAYQENFGGGEGSYYDGCDVAIIKYDSSGTQRLWATYLGGSSEDLPHSMIVNDLDELVIYGTTGSSDFPVTPGAYDVTFNQGDSIIYDYVLLFSHGIDIFVSKLSTDGSQLLASTFVGGTKNDGMNFPSVLSHNYGDGARGEIMTDKNNYIYVVSTTNSINFPVTQGSFQTNAGGGGQDGCVFKLNSNLSDMIWSSYLGGSGNDAAYGIVLDDNNNVYVTGGTTSSNFPTTTGVLYPVYHDSIDGFITKVSTNGNSILKSTFYGSNAYDQSYLIERDKSDNIYVYGQTMASGSTFIYNAAWASPNSGMFVSKMNANLNTLVWSTVFGTGSGVPNISPTAFHIDLCNKIYISGWGGSLSGFGGTAGLPITSDAFQTVTDNNDYYFLVISDDASSMTYGSFFGSPLSQDHVDGGTSRFDRKGRIYQSVCAGCGNHDDFPTTPGAWSNTNNSANCNNAVIKFDFLPNQVVAIANAFANDTGCVHYNYDFINNSNGVSYIWNFGDGSPLNTQVSPTHIYTNQGTYYVSLIATDLATCNISDTLLIKLDVFPSPFVNLGNDTCVETGITLDAGQGPDYVYSWSNGDTLQTINVYTTGSYYVEVFSGQDSTCISYDTVFVGIIPSPIISLSNDTLVSDIPEGNQWYDSNGVISGADEDTYVPTVSGNYYVIVTDTSGCISDTSNIIFVLITDLGSLTSDINSVQIFPNPASNKLQIETTQKSFIEILNLQGQIIKSFNSYESHTNVDISTLARGMYFVKVKTKNGIIVKKFVKE